MTRNILETFSKGAIDEDFLVENGIDFAACCAESSRLKTVLIGIRGDWWPQYSVLISLSDSIEKIQVGGYNSTFFGARLQPIYTQQMLHSVPVQPTGQSSARPPYAARDWSIG